MKERNAEPRINIMFEILLVAAAFSNKLTLAVADADADADATEELATTETVANVVGVWEVVASAMLLPAPVVSSVTGFPDAVVVLVTTATVLSPPGETDVSVATIVVLIGLFVVKAVLASVTTDGVTVGVVVGIFPRTVVVTTVVSGQYVVYTVVVSSTVVVTTATPVVTV